jgi:hypothetical protein
MAPARVSRAKQARRQRPADQASKEADMAKNPKSVKGVIIPKAKVGCTIPLGSGRSLKIKSKKDIVLPKALARVIPTAKQGCSA